MATVVYIVFLSLYELFIDPNIQTPEWLHIRSLDDLKKKLISALVIVMAVYFISVLENTSISSEEMSVIAFGIALMTFSMTYFLSKK